MRLCLGKREREQKGGNNIIRLENRTDRQVLVLMEECQKYVEVSLSLFCSQFGKILFRMALRNETAHQISKIIVNVINEQGKKELTT